MKANDVILQLAKRLPEFTTLFNDVLDATATSSGLTATVDTSPTPHDLTVGNAVIITGAQVPIVITSLSRVGTVATAICGAGPPSIADHDLTEFIPTQVIISGANNATFNGSKTLLSVPNRQTFTFQVADTGDLVDTGAPLLLNGTSALQTYNGVFEVISTPTPQTFTYTLLQELPQPIGGIVVNTNSRVSGAVEIERATQAYTKQNINKLWAFVVMGDTIASKNRSTLSDATSNEQRQQQGDAFRQQIISTVSVFVFIPSSSEVGGRLARDTAQDLFRPICQSILNERFDSGLFNAEYNSLQFNNHGFFFYNAAFYIHQYTFEQVEDLQFEDTVGFSVDVAFRDIGLTQQIDFGTELITASIDLDDVPL